MVQNFSTFSIKTFIFNPLQENTYIVFNSDKLCFIIDPGCAHPKEEKELSDFIISEGLKPIALLNTHCHIDHVVGNQFIKSNFKIPLIIPKEDEFLLARAETMAPMFGFYNFKSSKADQYFNLNETLKLDSTEFKLLHLPGHSPGSVGFYNEIDQVIISGDVLFKGSFGRVDLPGGSLDALKNSILKILFHLPENTIVFSGHGNLTNIKTEKTTNYILNF